MPQIISSFDPFHVALEQRPQGVEASAGTGKTYSIGILALRMILEQGKSTSELLMVTFTNAAVAELEIRVRSFIRKALKVARDPGADIQDKELKNLVLRYIGSLGGEVVLSRLNDASLLLEDLPIFTIHGFCTRTLGDFSFETRQLFDATMMSAADWDNLIEDHFNEFWRSEVAVLDPLFLRLLLADDSNKVPARRRILEMVRQAYAGKRIHVWSRPAMGILSPRHVAAVLKGESDAAGIRQDLLDAVRNRIGELQAVAAALSAKQREVFLPMLEGHDAEGFLAELKTSSDNGRKYAERLIAPIQPEWESWSASADARVSARHLLVAQIADHAVARISPRLSEFRKRMPTQTFDDLIANLRMAVESPADLERMREVLRQRYTAVFIDEFQDTDKDQYAIFNKIFGQGHFLYYIGDPKQSIYGFRKADINTYLTAMKEVEVIHQMNVNRRSSTRLIDAMNDFFLPNEDFDTFLRGQDLRYVRVQSPTGNDKAVLCQDGAEAPPIRISHHKNKPGRYQSLVRLVLQMTRSGTFTISEKGEHRAIRHSDIGIVVRTGREGNEVRKLLSKAGIPVISVDETKILHTDEAAELHLVLEAVLQRTPGTINKAMITGLVGLRISELERLKEEQLMERFRIYMETWTSKGVYVMLQQFLADHDVYDKFYQDSSVGAERGIANLLQLTDLLHRVALEEDLAPLDLVRWLKKGIDGRLLEGDEYLQRLERDEAAVKIVTIHKAKGLEYPIVLCPELDMKADPKPGRVSGWQQGDEYLAAESDALSANEEALEQFRAQQRQENRRLLYVAVTRAKQACFIFTGPETGAQANPDTLSEFLTQITYGPLIQKWDVPEEIPVNPRSLSAAPRAVYSEPPKFGLTDSEWRKSSFTALSPEHGRPALPRPDTDEHDELGKFTFLQLRRGSRSGDMMHKILEAIDFTNPGGWPTIVERIVNRFQPRHPDDFQANLLKWLGHITSVPVIPGESFTLSQLDWSSRKVELEFNFSLNAFHTNQLEKMAADSAPLRLKPMRMEGLMNGFIDLIFRRGDRYYILDWKTNYLGGTIGDYGVAGLRTAMGENNYHLQYHIYTVALLRYLELRLPDFDYAKNFGGVIYLFLRGIRQGSDTGLFHTRPEENLVRRMDELFRGRSEKVSVGN